MKGKYQKKKKKGSWLYYGALTILIAVFCGSGWYLLSYFRDSGEQKARYDELAAIVEAARAENPDSQSGGQSSQGGDAQEPEETGSEDGTGEESGSSMLIEYAPLYAMNPDMVGWLEIEGTRINYPVMQTPELPNYYLTRNFDRQDNARGCIYAVESADVNEPSDNITLFGHYMRDGSMFAGLNSYTKASFWEEHPYIQFDTLTERHTYAIFAVFRTTATENEGFAYHEFVDAADEGEFSEFVDMCVSLSIYDTGIVPEYGDKLLCLSTCEYSQTNGRLVVAAVRIN